MPVLREQRGGNSHGGEGAAPGVRVRQLPCGDQAAVMARRDRCRRGEFLEPVPATGGTARLRKSPKSFFIRCFPLPAAENFFNAAKIPVSALSIFKNLRGEDIGQPKIIF